MRHIYKYNSKRCVSNVSWKMNALEQQNFTTVILKNKLRNNILEMIRLHK